MLDVGQPNISLIKKVLVRQSLDNSSLSNQSSSSSAQSPLFDFPSIHSDDEKCTPTSTESASRRSYTRELEYQSEPEIQQLSPSNGSTGGSNNSKSNDSTGRLPLTPDSSSRQCHNIAESACGSLQRKRSATAACLSDSESESEQEKNDHSSAAMESTAKTSPVDSADGSEASAELTEPGRAKRNVQRSKFSRPTIPSPWRPSLLPKRISLSKEAEMKRNFPVRSSDTATTFSSSSTPPESTNLGRFQLPVSEEKSRMHTNRDSSPPTNPHPAETEQIAAEKPTFTRQVNELVTKAKETSSECDDFCQRVAVKAGTISSGSDDASLASPADDLTSATAVDTLSSSTLREANIEPHHPIDGLLSYSSGDATSGKYHPQFVLEDGILLIKNSYNVRRATYKLAITVSVTLVTGGFNEWFDLVIPGLPSLNGDDRGYFLFQMPERFGLEFDTTNLQRYDMVENCFFAEFTDPEDFVVPFRACDPRFYGVVKDFTLDQEIRSVHTVNNVLGEEHLCVRYSMICSVKLRNHCFWSERCCILLDLDGGPKGSFRCQLQPRGGLQTARLENRRRDPIGVSYLKIICCPKDLEMFCLSWETCIPGKRALNWLPRAHPMSYLARENRMHLRRKFVESESNLMVEENYADEIDNDTETYEGETDDDTSANGHTTEENMETDGKRIKRSGDYYLPAARTETFRSLLDSSFDLYDMVAYLKAKLINRRRTIFAVACIGFALFILINLQYQHASVSRRSSSAIAARHAFFIGDSSADGVNTSLIKNNSLNFWSDVFKAAKSKSHDTLPFHELHADTPVPMDEDSNNEYDGTNEPRDDDDKVKSNTVGEQSTESTPSNTIAESPGPSMRDRIDYLLGWSGPVRRTDNEGTQSQ